MDKDLKKIIKEIECYQNEDMCLIMLSQKENKALLDYITNLQEELKIMVKDDERSQETIIKLSKENERLKQHNRFLEDKIETYFDNVNMQNDLMIAQLDYKSRYDKAIEYIKNRKEEYNNAGDTRLEINSWHYNKLINDLLTILQNGSEDNER